MLEAMLAHQKIIPVITLDRVEDAVPLAEALSGGGLNVLEVTFRTEAAAGAIDSGAAARVLERLVASSGER